MRVTLPQKDVQPLIYLRRYFGGSMGNPGYGGVSYLYLNGKRAWDFLVLIAPLLSDRRMDQLVRACAKVAYFEGEEVVLCDRPLARLDRSLARK